MAGEILDDYGRFAWHDFSRIQRPQAALYFSW
jgi:hypothetical protein